MSDCFLQNQQIASFGLLLPQPRQFEEGSQPSLLVSKGPNKDFDLATITGKSAASIMRQAANKLWTFDEQKNLMLSPQANPRSGAPARRDYSPVRKNQMKGKDALEFSGDVLSFELQRFDGSLVSVLICILLSPRFLAQKYAVNGPFLFSVIELFRLKYSKNWLAMYEHAKVSYNNRANELKSNERRSFGNVETPVEGNEQPLQENIDRQNEN